MNKRLTTDVCNFINWCILFFLVIFAVFAKNNSWDVEVWTMCICILSFFTLLCQIASLKYYEIGIINIITFFFILNHIFNFGYYYIHLFAKDDFLILFTNWFTRNFDVKINAALFSLCAIQAIFCGVIIYIYRQKKLLILDYKISIGIEDELKEEMVFWVGVLLLIVSMPCKLYWDFQQVTLSTISAEYAGGFSQSGLVDDIQVLFIPALVCLISGKKNNKKKFAQIIMILYMVYSILIMTMSGARRAYITGILALFVFYNDFFSSKNHNRYKFIKSIGLLIMAIVCLNFLTLIRDSRHSALGLSAIFEGNFSDLFSIDFIWETLAEFGITGSVIYFSVFFVPNLFNYMYGSMYLSSIVYILPIGWLVKLNNASGGVIINKLAQSYKMTISSVGGSVLGDLYINWGWFSIIAAVILGYLIGKVAYISKKESEGINLKNIVAYSTGIVILNYARSSTSEILRPIVFVFASIYIGFWLILQQYKKKGYMDKGEKL